MKKTLIAILAIGLFAATAQAGLLDNPVPYAQGSDSAAWFTGPVSNPIDPVNGGVFTTSGPTGMSNFEIWFVAQGLGNVTQTGADPALTGSATLYLADISASQNFSPVGWTNSSITPVQYGNGSNYLSTTFSPGNYLPIYEASVSGLQVNLTPGDTYAWAVGLNLPGGVTAGFLSNSGSSCLATSNNLFGCNDNMYGFDVIGNTGTQYSGLGGANFNTNFAMSPEPGTWLLIAAGAGVLAIARRRKS